VRAERLPPRVRETLASRYSCWRSNGEKGFAHLPDLAVAFTERAFDAFRAYYEYVPKGAFEIEYTIRLNQSGTFKLPPTHVEALYEPEMLGDLPNVPFEVAP